MDNPFFSSSELDALADKGGSSDSLSGYRRFRELGRPLYLFGCGGTAQGVKDALAGLDVRGYLDNDPGKQGKIIHGLPVFTPVEVGERIRDENGLVVFSLAKSQYVREAAAQCAGLGLEFVNWADCYRHFEKPTPVDALAGRPEAAAALEFWEDEKSRIIFRDIVRFRTTLDENDRPAISEPQYFIDEIPPGSLRNFVDAGAYDGDTLRDFLPRYGDIMESYHAFEPMPEFQPSLERSAAGDDRVHIHQLAVSDFTGTARFSNQSSSSGLHDYGGIEVNVAKLDDVLAVNRTGFVKMDIEGAEPSALRGAEALIRREKPVLAICVYHQPAHLWEIPSWIRGLELGYRLLIRHHTQLITETVCYALPPD